MNGVEVECGLDAAHYRELKVEWLVDGGDDIVDE